MDASPLLLRPAEVAERLSLSRSVVYELLLRREIESVLICRSRRIPMAALVALCVYLRHRRGRRCWPR